MITAQSLGKFWFWTVVTVLDDACLSWRTAGRERVSYLTTDRGLSSCKCRAQA